MKKGYESPIIYMQRFEPNEYIATCATIVLDLYEDVTNGQTYHLNLENMPANPVVGQGYGGTMKEDPNAGFTAYYCGNGQWMIFGKIEYLHSYTDNSIGINGEYNYDGSQGHLICNDPVHQSLYEAYGLEKSQPHHFKQVTQHDHS